MNTQTEIQPALTGAIARLLGSTGEHLINGSQDVIPGVYSGSKILRAEKKGADQRPHEFGRPPVERVVTGRW
jgi:hypothetical protein